MARRVGCHPNTLSGYLSGARRVPFAVALVLVQIPEVVRAGFVLEDFVGDIPRGIPIYAPDDGDVSEVAA